MRFTKTLLFLATALLLVPAVPAQAELPVAGYIELTIARLSLVEAAWRTTGEPPPEEELDELYEEHGTDREAYLSFAGARRKEIEAYLNENPELRDEIESLSAAIRSEIDEREDE